MGPCLCSAGHLCSWTTPGIHAEGGVSTHLPLLGSQLPGDPGALRLSWCFVAFLGGCKRVLTAFPQALPSHYLPSPLGVSFPVEQPLSLLTLRRPLCPALCPRGPLLATAPSPSQGQLAGAEFPVCCPEAPGPSLPALPSGSTLREGGVSADRGSGRQGLY